MKSNLGKVFVFMIILTVALIVVIFLLPQRIDNGNGAETGAVPEIAGTMVEPREDKTGEVPAPRAVAEENESAAEVPENNSKIEPIQIAAPDNSSTGTSIVGRVLNLENESPVSDAIVRVYSSESVGGSVTEIKESRTDSEGRFRITGVPAPSVQNFQIEAQGFGIYARNLTIEAGKEVENIGDIKIKGGVTLEIKVMDYDTAQPVGNVEMMVEIQREGRWLFAMRLSAGQDGRRTIALPPYTFRIWAEAEGYAPCVSEELVLESQPVETKIYLKRCVTISGRVIDDLGNPVPGAWVNASAIITGSTCQNLSIFTDNAGAFIFKGCVPDFSYFLITGKHGYFQATKGDIAGGASGVDIQVSKGLLVRGKVACLEDGKPAAGCKVELIIGSEWQTCGVDANGLYEGLIKKDACEFHVILQGDGFVTSSTMKNDVPDNVGDSFEMNFTISRGIVLSGKITEQGGGKPIRNAVVHFEPEQVDNISPWTKSREDGSYTLSGLKPLKGRIRVSHPDYMPRIVEIEIVSSRDGLDFSLGLGCEISGSIKDESGKTGGRFYVAAEPLFTSKLRGGRGAGSLTIDEKGAFKISGLEPGRYELAASAWYEDESNYVSEPVEVETSENTPAQCDLVIKSK